MQINETASVSVGLSVTPASQTTFSVPLLLIDHADIPIDRRYRQLTQSSYSATGGLTASTTARNWCAALWGQNYNVTQAYIGRWVSAASSPYITFPSAVTTLASWTAISDGYLKITDNAGTPNTDEIGPLNFSSVTSMADVCTVIQTALQAITTPNITGLDTATCALDILSRPTITNSTSCVAAATISITTATTGTDIGGALYLGTDVVQAGLDTETLSAAMSAIFALDDTPYLVCQRGASIAQAVAFSTAVNSLKKYCFIVDDDADAKDSTASTDIGYQVNALSHQKTRLLYTEHTTNNGASADQFPDAAEIGEINARLDKEGGISQALNPLTGVSQSGLDSDLTTNIPLTTTEKTALIAKGYDFYDLYAGQVFARKGLSAGGNETRVMIGKEFFGAKVAEDFHAYLIANEVVTYSDTDIQALKSRVAYWANEMADRGLLDPETFVWNFPAASTFAAATKATHTLTLSDCFSATVFNSINDITITMNFSV